MRPNSVSFEAVLLAHRLAPLDTVGKSKRMVVAELLDADANARPGAAKLNFDLVCGRDRQAAIQDHPPRCQTIGRFDFEREKTCDWRSSEGSWSSKGLCPRMRRFPPPWSVEEQAACFIVRDANGQALAYVYFEDEPRPAIGGQIAQQGWGAPNRGEYLEIAQIVGQSR
jgi:hypothetical protein